MTKNISKFLFIAAFFTFSMGMIVSAPAYAGCGEKTMEKPCAKKKNCAKKKDCAKSADKPCAKMKDCAKKKDCAKAADKPCAKKKVCNKSSGMAHNDASRYND